jgi:farnesyl diphosphate synthase
LTPSRVPPISPVMNFDDHLKEDADAVEAVLTDLLRSRDDWPERLAEAMRYAVLGAGKRLRPFILIESARLLGVEGKGVLFAAAALECVHCYSLAHDDLPAMDDDDLRRGRPTVHRAFDEATAILVGDTLLTLAFEILANRATAEDAEIRVELAGRLARAAGASGMAGGQSLDLSGERKALSEDEIAMLQAMKTGALFRYAAEAGAILAGAGSTDRERLAGFGSALGAAFQLADDLLDHTGDSVSLGKVTHRDAEREKPTLVALLGEHEARTALATRIAAAEASLAPYGEKAAILMAATRFVSERS